MDAAGKIDVADELDDVENGLDHALVELDAKGTLNVDVHGRFDAAGELLGLTC